MSKKVKFKFQLSLRELRKKAGFKQQDIKNFKQASVSKIESRKDLKLSTLVEYLDNINMDLEIRAIVREESKEPPEYILFRTDDETGSHTRSKKGKSDKKSKKDVKVKTILEDENVSNTRKEITQNPKTDNPNKEEDGVDREARV